ncbi:hypothetical protein PUNSTDRAFT_94237 [Punctularia strigosozonata HHB-11173 SS5]|uniref:uncharacterized protein n=1 Tax=Punctularia strigosozonata (strain HHB-11173) TaxID=741275 RepID=UPI000441693C|nr:uncharacterized protein PUNSTDRAFT_94237 [Punctularia strigosozonata HHB-11173 SS5]EIN13237.1 hypothetical protein PUNSTDRAFT_94237 [Punctularia strigosozonata HHB-11173 SS5]
MVIFWRIPALVVILAICVELIIAHSAPARPIKRLAHPSTLSLEILPRRPSAAATHANRRRSALPSPSSPILLHSDSLRLVLSAFSDTFHLHLRPNDALIHPAARVTYVNPDGTSRSEPLLRESVKAYWGEVVPADISASRMRADAAGALPTPEETLGWARVMVHEQGDATKGVAPVFEGAFSVHGVVHHVMTKDNYLRTKHALDPQLSSLVDAADRALVIWRDSDKMTVDEERAVLAGQPLPVADGAVPPARAQSCGHDRLAYNAANDILQRPLQVEAAPWYDPYGLSLARRDDVASGSSNMSTNFADDIGNTSGCPKEQKVLYMGVAADCEYVSAYGSTSNATSTILNNWNKASALYKSTFNVSLGIVELQVHNATCPTTVDASAPWNRDCASNVTLNDRLSLFSEWRGDKGGSDGAGLWHLMSGCPTGDEVGIAWLATLCNQGASKSGDAFVSGTAVSTAGKTEWQVIAHEIGHNFGAIHDCADGCNSTSSCCPLTASSCDANSQFLMSPVAETGEMVFSQCTIGNICSVMASAAASGAMLNTTCLVDAAQAHDQITLQMCGNGIVEAGEECDPGQGTNSTCCDAATCKFAAGAVCDPLDSACCTDTCTFAPATKVCRTAKDPRCDTAEMCTGSSADCPADVFAANGKSCGPGLACASGTCTSNTQQCQSVGASMGLQEACGQTGDKSCQVSCQDPTNSKQCIVLQASLIDGSPCGYGGTCATGKCRPGSLLATAKSFYTSNLQISIPVTVVVGLLALLLLYGIYVMCRSCCCGPREDEPKPTIDSRFVGGSIAPVVSAADSNPLQNAQRISAGNSYYRGETRRSGEWEKFHGGSQEGGPPPTYIGWQDDQRR